MHRFGINRDDPERYTELVDYHESNKDNNSYMVADCNHSGSVIGLVDLVNPVGNYGHNNNVVKNGLLFRLNGEAYEHADGERILREVNDNLARSTKEIPTLDFANIVKQLFASEFPETYQNYNNIDIRLKLAASLIGNGCSKRKRHYDLRMVRKFEHKVENHKISLQFESRLDCKELFPIATNFGPRIKSWIGELVDNVRFIEDISSENFEIIEFLLNDPVDQQYLTMNQNNMRKLKAIFNRANITKIKETEIEQEDLIEDLKSMCNEVHSIIRKSWADYDYDYRSSIPKPENGIKVSIKGIDFAVDQKGVFVNVIGETKKILGKGYTPSYNTPILGKALAYIVSLGNEHELLHIKLEEKLLMAI